MSENSTARENFKNVIIFNEMKMQLEHPKNESEHYVDIPEPNDISDFSRYSDKTYQQTQCHKTIGQATSINTAPKTVAYQKRGEQSEIGSKTTTEPELDLASEENENMHEAQMFSISIVGNRDNEADSTMTKVSSMQENDTEKIDTTSLISSSTSFSTENPAMSMTESYTALLTKYEKLKETAKNDRLEIATMQIEKGLAESSLDFIIEQVAKLDSIEALKNLQNRYAICSVKF